MTDPANAGEGLDLKVYVQAILRRRWLVVGVWVTVFAAVALYTIRQPKVYEAACSLIIDAQSPRVLENQASQEVLDNGTGTYWFNKEYYETQYKVIVSRAVSQRVVDKLGLAHDLAFLGLAKVPPGPARDEAVRNADPAARLQSRIKVVPAKDSRLVSVLVEDSDPERAALLANEVAEAFIAENLALKLRATESASKWLEERLTELQKKSDQSELAVYAFKKDADMLTASLEDRLNMVSQRLGTYNTQLTEVRARIAAISARVEAFLALQNSAAAGQEHWAEAIAATSSNPLLGQLKVRIAEQRSECAALSEKYLDKHPALETCRTKLAAARQELGRELDNVVKAAQLELAEARNNEKNLLGLVNATKAEAFEVNKKQIEFGKLERDSANDQRLFENVLKRLKDIELSGLLRTSNVRVLDAARPAYAPVKPNVRGSLMFALALGLFAGVGLVIGLELLDNTVSSQEDVEERLQLPYLGLMPSLAKAAEEERERDLFVHRQPKSPSAEFCRAIRTNLLFMTPDKPLRTMLVTSSGAQEGKSTTAINLGVTMAQSGNRTLLVDTDMRRPRLHRAFGVPNDVGVSSLVVGEGTVEAAVKSTEVPGLFVLTCGPIPPNPAELLHTEAFRELLEGLADRFDRVILDSPPLSAVADAAVLATQVDGVVLVLKGGKTTRELARRAVRALDDVNAKLLGVILNAVSLDDPKYGGYYNYYAQQPAPAGGKDGGAA